MYAITLPNKDRCIEIKPKTSFHQHTHTNPYARMQRNPKPCCPSHASPSPMVIGSDARTETIAISWIRAKIAARCIQRRWRSRRAAAIIIKKALRRALANPNYTMCKNRLIHECMQMHASF